MAAALLAGMAWMAALTQLELSQAYPLMGFSFVLILIFSAVCFQEPITWVKVIGVFLIVGGDHRWQPGMRICPQCCQGPLSESRGYFLPCVEKRRRP